MNANSIEPNLSYVWPVFAFCRLSVEMVPSHDGWESTWLPEAMGSAAIGVFPMQWLLPFIKTLAS